MNREAKLGTEVILPAVHKQAVSVLQGIHKAALEKPSHLNMEKTVKIAKNYLSLPRQDCNNFRDCIAYSQLFQMKSTCKRVSTQILGSRFGRHLYFVL